MRNANINKQGCASLRAKELIIGIQIRNRNSAFHIRFFELYIEKFRGYLTIQINSFFGYELSVHLDVRFCMDNIIEFFLCITYEINAFTRLRA